MKLLKHALVPVLPLAALLIGSTPAAAGTGWTEFVYNPSGQALMPMQPPEVLQNSVRLDFVPGQFIALLTTSDSALTGDLSGTTLTDFVSVQQVTGSVVDQNNGGCTPDSQFVRFYFTSPAGSGPSFPTSGPPLFHGGGGTPAGFYSSFWWSNPVHVDLVPGILNVPMSVVVGDTTQWSDWNGQMAGSSPEVTARFDDAVRHVQSVGLSFGGGCFFENGVSVDSGGGAFESEFIES